MNRKEIKAEAKKILRENLFKIITPYLIIEFISFIVIYMLQSNLRNENLISLYTSCYQFLIYPINIGLIYYILKIIDKKEPEPKDLFSFYHLFFQIFALYFIINLLTMLGLTLLIIPGIIIAITYNFAPYILADGEIDPIQSLKKSKKIIYGFKWDYFKFILSFIGWLLLIFIAFWYVVPYIMISCILYYRELKKRAESN